MTTSTNTSASNLNVVEKSSTANAEKAVKTHRVLETRSQWLVIFNHAVSLVVALAKGEALDDDPRKGFAFGKVADQPHSRAYAQALLVGFVSRKAGKVFAQTKGLADQADREKIAKAILTSCKLALKGDAAATLNKVEPKQAKTFAEAVLSELNKTDKPSPTEKKTKTKAASPKEKKTRKPSTRKTAK